MWVTYLLYFGYMAVISVGVFLVTGKTSHTHTHTLSLLSFTNSIYYCIYTILL